MENVHFGSSISTVLYSIDHHYLLPLPHGQSKDQTLVDPQWDPQEHSEILKILMGSFKTQQDPFGTLINPLKILQGSISPLGPLGILRILQDSTSLDPSRHNSPSIDDQALITTIPWFDRIFHSITSFIFQVLWGTKTPGQANDQRDEVILTNKRKVFLAKFHTTDFSTILSLR